MSLFLQIIGAIVLILVLVIALVGFVLLRKWRAFQAQLEASQLNPLRISLREDPVAAWIERDEVKRERDALQGLGFVRGAAYTIDEMQGVRLLALCHPQACLFGCIYQHDLAGVFVDLVAESVAGDQELTVTSAPVGAEIDARPEAEKVFMKGASVAVLFDEILTRTKDWVLADVSNDMFPEKFESAYRKDMAWRAERGGISVEEIRRVAANQSESYDDEAIDETVRRMKVQEIQQWEAECLESFATSTDLSVQDWHKYTDKMFIFRDTLQSNAFVDYFAEHAAADEDDAVEDFKRIADRVPLRELLSKMCDEWQIRIRKLGAVATPINVEIYAIEPDE